jgi:hypothetical protein
MDLSTASQVILGVLGLILTISTFILNLIYKEMKELRASIQHLVLENGANRERIVRLEEFAKTRRCKECRDG